ncbi:MAG: hypothetical protein COT35_08195, partial [Nitrospirae bacterium CG08_land_8_20_14_0_20_52_24]
PDEAVQVIIGVGRKRLIAAVLDGLQPLLGIIGQYKMVAGTCLKIKGQFQKWRIRPFIFPKVVHESYPSLIYWLGVGNDFKKIICTLDFRQARCPCFPIFLPIYPQ